MRPVAPPVGALLKRWRSHRGLSQLALALEAGLSARHLSFLETGRSRPSPASLRALADALGIPLRERNALFEAAGFAPPYAESSLSAPDAAYHRRLIEAVLRRHEPYFAVAIDRHWDVRLRNEAAARSLERYAGTGAAPEGSPPNLARLLLHPEGLMTCLLNGPEVAAHFVARLRQESLRNPLDERLAQLVAEMESYAGARAVPSGPLGGAPLALDLLVDGHRLALLPTVLAFDTARSVALEELRIETFFPADEATAALLDGLAAHLPAPAAREG